MNMKFIISVVVLFVVTMLFGYVVHEMLLGDAYRATGLFRTMEDAENYFVFMLLGHLSLAVGLTWVYRMGHEPSKAWLGQGVRFGLALFFLMPLAWYLIYHAVQPMPLELATQQILYDGVAVILVGIIAAFINK